LSLPKLQKNRFRLQKTACAPIVEKNYLSLQLKAKSLFIKWLLAAGILGSILPVKKRMQ
jgi:hypothetical protein